MSVATAPTAKGTAFMDEVVQATPNGYRLRHCLQCGTCGGSCPNGPDMDYTPRGLFALIAANEREKVLSANTMWFCVSCYLCTVRCPKQVPITETMYTLKEIAFRERQYGGTDAAALARTFTDLLEKYGRSYELGLASRFYLLNKPTSLLQMGPMGLAMMSRGRMTFIPTKIRGTAQLRAIIHKAKELGD